MDITLNKQLNRGECWKKHKETTQEKSGFGMPDHNPVRLNPLSIPRVKTTTYHDISVFSNLFFDGSHFV
jgi:hypothetical protein